jgi:hypothetical protein
MRYLKRINEMIYGEDKLEEIQEFCNLHIAYLIDNGFGIRVRNGSNSSRVRIEFYKDNYHLPVAFSWDEVKDYFIPFFSRLYNKYPLWILDDRVLDGSIVKGCLKISYQLFDNAKLWESASKWLTKEEVEGDLLSQCDAPYVNKMLIMSVFIG